MVGDEATAEDLLSDVFLDVWREADRFGGRSAVATWLLGIARFKSLWWNPEDGRLFTPRAFGWGYDLNLARLLRRR